MTDTEKAISLLQQCLDERPYASVRVNQIMSCIQEAVDLLKEQGPEEDETESSVRQADAETVMNLIKKALRETGYETVGCDNTLYVFGCKCLSTGGEAG